MSILAKKNPQKYKNAEKQPTENQYQSSKPPKIETWNTINQLRFCQIFRVSSTPAQTQSPLAETLNPPTENFLATVVLKTKIILIIKMSAKGGAIFTTKGRLSHLLPVSYATVHV